MVIHNYRAAHNTLEEVDTTSACTPLAPLKCARFNAHSGGYSIFGVHHCSLCYDW